MMLIKWWRRLQNSSERMVERRTYLKKNTKNKLICRKCALPKYLLVSITQKKLYIENSGKKLRGYSADYPLFHYGFSVVRSSFHLSDGRDICVFFFSTQIRIRNISLVSQYTLIIVLYFLKYSLSLILYLTRVKIIIFLKLMSQGDLVFYKDIFK